MTHPSGAYDAGTSTPLWRACSRGPTFLAFRPPGRHAAVVTRSRRFPMKIALVAQRTTLLDRHDTPSDPERIRLAKLASQLAGNGHQVTVYAQKLDPGLPDRGRLPAGARVEHLGPARDGATRESAADERELLTQVPAFTGPLRDRLSEDRPDVVHALRWTSGLAALAASRGLRIPVVQSFDSLGVTERRHHVIARDAGI